ncbi:hypothetical protein GCM10023160_22950 [Brachybacterium paraconglomeratum]|uniref:CehA/McbA family metallohydrolase n=1 Tax=Brachybacterium paraconglomeratum TaxID=173362 RepID=UPI0031F13F13
MSGQRIVHRLVLGREHQQATPLLTVPFEVPAGATSLEVRLVHDRKAATIDLGLEGPAGWRGWSGGARESFVIQPGDATPGYLPGAPEPGRWDVQLGLYRMPERPLPVSVEIHLPSRSPLPPELLARPHRSRLRASARGLPAAPGLVWLAGDFHSHSTHSDGEQSLDELAGLAAGHGLDFLAVTEHNTVSHLPHLAGVGARHGISLLPGQEVTTPQGHANAFGEIPWVDFRREPSHWRTDVARQGGLLSINHPLVEDTSWGHLLDPLPPALELWHVSWFLHRTDTAPWALMAQWPQQTVLLGGSDYHHPRHGYLPGTPTTWVAAEENSPRAILEAARAGRTALTMLPTQDAPALVRREDELIALDADGTVLKDLEGRSQLLHGRRVVIPATGHGPYRLETPAGELLAISP